MIGGILVTLAAGYLIGVVIMIINCVRERPWAITPRPTTWQYRPAGIAVGVVINAALWPAVLITRLREARP